MASGFGVSMSSGFGVFNQSRVWGYIYNII